MELNLFFALLAFVLVLIMVFTEHLKSVDQKEAARKERIRAIMQNKREIHEWALENEAIQKRQSASRRIIAMLQDQEEAQYRLEEERYS